MAFEFWSKTNPSIRKTLSPDLGVRTWGELSEDEKGNIWLHFTNKGWFGADKYTHTAIYNFNEDTKARAFCRHILSHGGPHYMEMRGIRQYMEKCCHEAAQQDFHHIFHKEHQDVVYELISYYVPTLANDVLDKEKQSRFKSLFNDISNQFGLNVLMGKGSFTLRQDEKITKEIFEPVLNFLADEKWKPVNRDLNDSVTAYLKNTEEGYSSSITLTISALQAFLQILVYGKTGKGDIGQLIKTAQEKNLIPSDPFTKKIFRDIESILMQERQTKGHPHPKSEYANEKSARLALNLVMIFMQHCIQD